MTPQILAPDYGAHNAMLDQAIKRLDYAGSYKDLSTIIVIPGFGQMPTKCVFVLATGDDVFEVMP